MSRSRFSSQRASHSVPAGCASRGAPRASREILRRRKAVRLPSMLNLLCLVSRLPFFSESHPSACEEKTGFQPKVRGINPKAYPKSAYISVGKQPCSGNFASIVLCWAGALGVWLPSFGEGGLRAPPPRPSPRADPSRCPASRCASRPPPRAIGKQLFSAPFPQLKGRKNKKLPQLVKIFLDTQLSP